MRRRGRRDCGLGRRGPHFEVAGVSRQGWGPGLVSKGEAIEAPARPPCSPPWTLVKSGVWSVTVPAMSPSLGCPSKGGPVGAGAEARCPC